MARPQTTNVYFTVLQRAVLLAACGSDQEEKIFSEVRSPDGAWTAQAVDERHFGPGNAAHFIRVTLNGSSLDHRKQDVLLIEPAGTEGYPGHRGKHISLAWQSPTRLVLSYHDAKPEFVVARFAGVDIVSQAR